MKCRRVRGFPPFISFVPKGAEKVSEVNLTMDEFESIRLKDHVGLDQVKAAKEMGVSQPTFNRTLSSARKKIADAIVNGKVINIKGGNYVMVDINRPGRGRMGGFGLGPGGECVCPKCGTRIPHQRGIPCYQHKCPKCGTMMTRA